MICGLVEHCGKFVFSKNDGRESTVAVRLLLRVIFSIRLLIIVKLHFQETDNIHTHIFVRAKMTPIRASFLRSSVKLSPVSFTNTRYPSILRRKLSTMQKSNPKTDLEKLLKACVNPCTLYLKKVINVILG